MEKSTNIGKDNYKSFIKFDLYKSKQENVKNIKDVNKDNLYLKASNELQNEIKKTLKENNENIFVATFKEQEEIDKNSNKSQSDKSKKFSKNLLTANIIFYSSKNDKEVYNAPILIPQDLIKSYDIEKSLFNIELKDDVINEIHKKETNDIINKCLEIEDDFIELEKLNLETRQLNKKLQLLKANNQDDILYQIKNKELEENLNKIKEKINVIQENICSKTNLTNLDQGNINKLNSIVEEILKEDNSYFVSALKEERGHSEDYLYYLINNRFDDVRNVMDIKSKGIYKQCDKFIVIINSTRDACNRCLAKINELVDVFKEKMGNDIDVKAIYSGTFQMNYKSTKDANREYNDDTSGISNSGTKIFNIISTPIKDETENLLIKKASSISNKDIKPFYVKNLQNIDILKKDNISETTDSTINDDILEQLQIVSSDLLISRSISSYETQSDSKYNKKPSKRIDNPKVNKFNENQQQKN